MSTATFDFILPDIGEGISEALLITWNVDVGQDVEEGETIATMSTDKVDVELPAPRTGKVSELCGKPGDTIQVGSVLMRIDTGDAKAEAPSPGKKQKPGARNGASGQAPVPQLVPGEGAPGSAPAMPGGPILAAPSTRKLAADLGIDLAGVSGSGDGGMIMRADVERAAQAGPAAPAAASVPAASVTAAGGERREPLNGVRAVMAERMAQSVHTLAHSTMNFEMRAEAFLDLIGRLKPGAEAAGIKLTPTALLVKCLEAALRRHPRFNARIDEEARELVMPESVNLGVAMATERGLVVPVLPGLNGQTLFAIARRLNDTVNRARAGELAAADMAGGTFTLSNTGGLERATITSTRPVINMPQTATLWISRVQDRPVVDGGELTAGKVMNASLSFDHRFIDGADTLAFINDFAALIEAPEHALAGE
jgi:pyruvate/2-oxoglutarate dehydrogenase complex dihydrolipoamide acyltransferase (E2) component